MNLIGGNGNGNNSQNPNQMQQLQNQIHASSNNKNLINLQQQQQQQQQQQLLQSGMSQLNSNLLGGSNNTSNNLLGLAGFNNNSVSNSSNSGASVSNNLAQTQAQLIESYRVAVQLGLVTPDLLNIKLPPDVLALIYQLFQTLTQFNANKNKMNNLNTRRSQLSPQQFKAEMDMLGQETQTQKDTINILQVKINTAHNILKQQQGKMSSNGGNINSNGNSLSNSFSASSSNSGNMLGNQTSPLGNLSSSQSALVNSLGGLNLSSEMVNSLAAAGVSDSKLLKLLDQNKFGGNNNGNGINLNRQASLQPQQQQQQQQVSSSKQNSFFTQSLSSNSSTPSLNQSQWGGQGGGLFDQQTGVLDDRITPFIPGQLWTGGQNAEDDPNCTPGSFSKPLLTETIDPESILNSLQRSGSSQWPNSLDLLNLNNNLLSNNSRLAQNGAANGSNRMNNMAGNNSWSSNGNGNQFMPQLSLQNQNLLSNNNGSSNNGNGNSSSIGEQLWGVRNNNGNGNNSNQNNGRSNQQIMSNQSATSLNRNASSFNTNPLMNQQQQQNFFRSNSWNIAGGQQQQLGNSGDGRNSSQNINNFNNMSANGNNNANISINGGHYLLIKNITPQIDQLALKTLCAQQANGPLTYFRYIANLGVIVRYNTKEEASSAHSKLNSISLGNTTLTTQYLTEQDLK